MKIRQGFVSNSSSSSFIINKNIFQLIPKDYKISFETHDELYNSKEILLQIKKIIKKWNRNSICEKDHILYNILFTHLYRLCTILINDIKMTFLPNRNSISKIFNENNQLVFSLNNHEINLFVTQYLKQIKIDITKLSVYNEILLRWIQLIKINDIAIIQYDNDVYKNCYIDYHILSTLSKENMNLIKISK